MTVRIYVRASTKDQDAKRALSDLISFSQSYDDNHVEYVEHFSGTKLDRPALTLLLNDAEEGDILLVESVDRLSRLSQDDFAILKQRIKDKGLRLVVADLPTTHTVSEGMTGEILKVINDMLIDLLEPWQSWITISVESVSSKDWPIAAINLMARSRIPQNTTVLESWPVKPI